MDNVSRGMAIIKKKKKNKTKKKLKKKCVS